MERTEYTPTLFRLSTRIAKATQTVQPYQFGDDASKRTCLWMYGGLPALEIPPRELWHPGRWAIDPRNGKRVQRWSNQTDSGQNRLGPSEERAGQRSESYPGICAALAMQMTAAVGGELRLAA